MISVHHGFVWERKFFTQPWYGRPRQRLDLVTEDEALLNVCPDDEIVLKHLPLVAGLECKKDRQKLQVDKTASVKNPRPLI